MVEAALLYATPHIADSSLLQSKNSYCRFTNNNLGSFVVETW